MPWKDYQIKCWQQNILPLCLMKNFWPMNWKEPGGYWRVGVEYEQKQFKNKQSFLELYCNDLKKSIAK